MTVPVRSNENGNQFSNLQTPNTTILTSGPTQNNSAAAARNAVAVSSPTAGVITGASTSRQIQLGLKLLF